MKTDTCEHIKHLRAVNFALVLASFSLLGAAILVVPADIDRAIKQLESITQLAEESINLRQLCEGFAAANSGFEAQGFDVLLKCGAEERHVYLSSFNIRGIPHNRYPQYVNKLTHFIKAWDWNSPVTAIWAEIPDTQDELLDWLKSSHVLDRAGLSDTCSLEIRLLAGAKGLEELWDIIDLFPPNEILCCIEFDFTTSDLDRLTKRVSKRPRHSDVRAG